MSSEGIEEKAVKEILKDTKRAAARAAVGGPQSWTKGNKGKDINKRFLNNTVLSTVYNNSKDKKVKVRGQLTREDKALFKAAEKLKSKEVSIDSKAREPKKSGSSSCEKRQGGSFLWIQIAGLSQGKTA